jgi:hypothetical protein
MTSFHWLRCRADPVARYQSSDLGPAHRSQHLRLADFNEGKQKLRNSRMPSLR